jgi:hypothetical protein
LNLPHVEPQPFSRLSLHTYIAAGLADYSVRVTKIDPGPIYYLEV